MGEETEETGPDLTKGVSEKLLEEKKPFLGQVGDEAVILVREGEDIFAVGATCSHYGGPLAKGIVEDGSVRCPWHHARFNLRTGEPASPGLDAVSCYEVQKRGGLVTVGVKKARPPAPQPTRSPSSVVIVGSGTAGSACVEELRRRGYEGPITLIGEEPPVDRPNLSKDFLAGNAPEEWLPLRSAEFFESLRASLVSEVVTRVDRKAKKVVLGSGREIAYDALLLATGAEPLRLPVEGADMPHVRLLRTLDDSRAIIERAENEKHAVVLGAGFIGLEVAASLKKRGLSVDVVAPEAVPLSKPLGEELGKFVKGVHEANGVRFHLNARAKSITKDEVVLEDGTRLKAGLVVIGAGVRPRTKLAEDAGLDVDNGVLVDDKLRTSDPHIFAAGDIARYPDPTTGEPVRVEHWVHAGRMGQAAARSMLGEQSAYTDPPFFWSWHFDKSINRVGSGDKYDSVDVHGSLADGDAIAAYRRKGRIIAVATVGRSKAALLAEVALQRGDEAGLEALLN